MVKKTKRRNHGGGGRGGGGGGGEGLTNAVGPIDSINKVLSSSFSETYIHLQPR